MSSIDDMLDARAQESSQAPQQGKASDIDSMLEARAAGGMKAQAAPSTAPAVAAEAPTRTQRFVQGLTDLPVAAGQLVEHTPVLSTITHGWRGLIRASLSGLGANNAASLFDPVESEKFDKAVQSRENEYQQARTQAGQTGIDWWRLGGAASNPVNYIAPGGVAASVGGRIGQAALQGGISGALQPTTEASNVPGSFWWDKAKGTTLGAATGSILSSVIEGVTPLLRAGANSVKTLFGKGAASQVPPSGAAETIVNEALKKQGADPNTLNVNVLAGMKQEVQSALEHGAEPSQEAIANRAIAESLPIPIHLTRANATGVGMANEDFLMGIKGAGEPLAQRAKENNAAAIANLDALGAKDAPDPVSTGSKIQEAVQNWWQKIDDQKSAAYDAVRNSKGQPAMMDQFSATQQIRDALDTPQAMHAWDSLPGHVQRTIEDLEEGKLPLTVAQFQALDKAWGREAASKAASDGTAAYAINTARRILGEAPIQDDVGKEALAAYQAAKSMHAQQMGMIDPKLPNGRPNPNFQPIVKSVVVDGTAPEKIFQKHFMGEAPSVAAKNSAALQKIDPSMPEDIGRTMMGEIKRLALNNASEERGAISQPVLNSWAKDPVKSARMEALLPQPLVGTFKNLAKTVENMKRFSVGEKPNTSNTASALVNAGVSMAKNSALGKIAQRIPGIKAVSEELKSAGLRGEVNQAVNPGVTLKSLVSATPSQAAKSRLAARLALPAAISAEQPSDGSNE